jgi:hypothetical protein
VWENDGYEWCAEKRCYILRINAAYSEESEEIPKIDRVFAYWMATIPLFIHIS